MPVFPATSAAETSTFPSGDRFGKFSSPGKSVRRDAIALLHWDCEDGPSVEATRPKYIALAPTEAVIRSKPIAGINHLDRRGDLFEVYDSPETETAPESTFLRHRFRSARKSAAD